MSELFEINGNKLCYHYENETLIIEGWGNNAFRIRAAQMGQDLEENDWALSEPHIENVKIKLEDKYATIVNGKICAEVTSMGNLSFYNQEGKLLLQEYIRNRGEIKTEWSGLDISGREMQAIMGTDLYTVTARFESDPDEKLFGMGQYQQPFLNLKGCTLELAQRNSQASVPFLLSDRGYGFLWNNPAVGMAVFGKNLTQWQAQSSKILDYWITAGDTPAEIEESYASVTGKVPMMPDFGMGFWQCKLRYRTQKEVLEAAREYKRRGLPIDVIVIDYFHWSEQGNWDFDPVYWPDPEKMIDELKEMGIELMVSIWPTVDKKSKNYDEMRRNGYLIQCDRGVQTSFEFLGSTIFYDATNPKAQEYVWKKIKKNYYEKGIKTFWLDEAEPEYSSYNFDNYRYYIGSNLQIGNIYPVMYAKTFYEGMREEGQENIVNLVRCAWAGSQKYGVLAWSGDIASSFKSMKNQLAAGLNMGIAGIPWWTTDIGGFYGGDPEKEDFRELFARWFEWGAFCPVMRLHGNREPELPKLSEKENECVSGAPNEVWCYGEEIYKICEKYMKLREKIRPYTARLMKEAHEKGTPIMRTLFYEFPKDEKCWEVEDEYFYGDGLLVAPVLEAGQRKRKVYLPEGCRWRDYETGEIYQGGETIIVDAPLDKIPVFEKIVLLTQPNK